MCGLVARGWGTNPIVSRAVNTGLRSTLLAGGSSLTAIDDELVMMNTSMACMSNGDTAVQTKRRSLAAEICPRRWKPCFPRRPIHHDMDKV